jgi:ligand-binding sensor domain-containing protein
MIADPARGGLWLGFRDGTGLAYLKDGSKVVRVDSGNSRLGRGLVGNILIDSAGNLWAGTEGDSAWSTMAAGAWTT